MLLTKPSDDLPLAKAQSCPAWIEPNAGANGYYHATIPSSEALENLTPAELVSTLGDAGALVESGGVKPSQALALAPRFAANEDHHVMNEDEEVAGMTEASYMPASTWPEAAAFIDKVFGPRARELGWKGNGKEGDNLELLRHDLVRFAAASGDDAQLVRQAEALARQWLKDPKAVPAGELADVLAVAAQHGNRELFDKLRAAAISNHDHHQRQALIHALGEFRDPAIAKDAMALLLTNDFDAREAFFPLLFGPLQYPATRDLPLQFVKAHIDELLKRMPREVGGDFAAELPKLGDSFCDAAHRDDLESFFKDRIKTFVGGPRTLEQTVETINVCIAQRQAIAPGVEQFLNAQAAR